MNAEKQEEHSLHCWEAEDRLVSGEPWRKSNKNPYDNCVTQKTSRTM